MTTESRKREWLNKEQFDNLITIFVLAVAFGFLIGAYFHGKTTVEQKSQVITAVISIVSVVVGYRWGSSRSANRKDETIDQLLTPNPGSTTVTTTQNNKED